MQPSKRRIEAEKLFSKDNEEEKMGQSLIRELGGEDTRERRHLFKSYNIKKDLGEGTFGKVVLAVHNDSKEKVAIKMLEKSKIVDDGDRERVSREIQILKILRHPNIVQLYEIIEDSTHLYLVMEYASGGELFDYIVAQQRVRETESSRFFQQIIDGIEYIHKLKIVHRDLKPENLLLDEYNNIKLVDFGLSNLYKEGQLLKTACGSPCYAAPEMIAGKEYKGLKVDIWSAGVILFALICGHLPFDDGDTQILYKRIMKGDYMIPSFVSHLATDLIKRILNTDPEKRLNIDQIKAHQWFNLYKGYTNLPKGLIIEFHEVPVDEKVVDAVSQFGYERDVIYQSVRANRQNMVSTLYYLLLRKMIRKDGYRSNSDINSIFFKPKLLDKVSAVERAAHEDSTMKPVQTEQKRNTSPEADVSAVLSKHHKEIQEKAKLANKNHLNITKNKDFEENLDLVKPPRATKRREEGHEERKRQNRTQNISKQNKNSDSGVAAKNFETTSREPVEQKPAKDARASSTKPAINQSLKLPANSRKPTNSKQNARSPTPDRPSPATNLREEQSLFASQQVDKRGGVGGPQRHAPDKRATQGPAHNYMSVANPQSTSGANGAQAHASQELEMSVHRGPLNLNAVSMRDPNDIMGDIVRALQELGVQFKKKERFSLNCSSGDLKFVIEISMVEKYKTIYVVKFYKSNQSSNNYFELCQNIFAKIAL